MSPPSAWLRSASGFPPNGLELTVTYRTGNRSSRNHVRYLNPVLSPVFGSRLFPGSLNLWASSPIAYPDPAVVPIEGFDWKFVPIVIMEDAVGVAARRADSGDIKFIEVFAPTKLAPHLGLTPEDQLTVRLLSGAHLGLMGQGQRRR